VALKSIGASKRGFARPARRRGALSLAAMLAVCAAVGAAPGAGARERTDAGGGLEGATTEPALQPAQRAGGGISLAQRGGGISLAQATAMATSRYQGRVVRAETVQRGDRVVHEIRILGDDGRVRTVRVDAQSGAFL
jgi:hypothetical protein